jgi:hypothetical protein
MQLFRASHSLRHSHAYHEQVTRVDPFTAEIALGVTSEGPLCAGSSTEGKLQAVFLTHPFFLSTSSIGSTPYLLNLEDGSIKFNRPYCSDPTASLKTCQVRLE